MEPARKAKALVPVEVWAPAAPVKEKVAAREAAGDKAVVAARAREKANVKGAARDRDPAADKTRELC